MNTLRNLDGGKLYSGRFNLSPVDILNLDPRKPIYVHGTYYRLNAIKDYTGDDTCEVELFKTAGKKLHKAISEISGEVPNGYNEAERKKLVPVFMRDTRVRPNNMIDLVVRDENGNLVKIYVEG